ncbi:MAG: hypothetical protein KJ621_19340 [Proteobacteria bacterium]|nr:hypothetical protein [Pseudomonadota bacterium]MBU1740153.1 hypothetical protein [Pseudomonadota bacterium]
MRRIAVFTTLLVLGGALWAGAQKGLLKWPESGAKPTRPQPTRPTPPPGPTTVRPPAGVTGGKMVLADRFQVGEKYISVFSLSIDARMSFTAGGRPQVKKLSFKTFERYGQIVMAVDPQGGASRVKRKYFVSYEVEEGRKKTKWYQGKLLVLTRQGRKTFVSWPGGAVPGPVRQELSDELAARLALSDQPVGVGDRWVLTEQTLRRFMDLPPAARGTVRCRWSKTITSQAGHQVATIAANMVLTLPLPGGLRLDVDLTGKLFYNLSLRKLEALIFRGPVTIKGALAQGRRRIPVTGGGRASIVMLRRFGR